MNKRILMVLTSHSDLGGKGQTGYYIPEAAHPYDVFKTQGYDVEFVSPKGGQPPQDGLDETDARQMTFLQDNKDKLSNTNTPAQINPLDYQAIFYVGGHGTMWDLPNNTTLASIAATIYDNGGVVGAVCHGPAGLVNVRLANGEFLVKDKTVAAFTNSEEETVELTTVVPFLLETKLIERGANHVPAPDFAENVQVSGRLVTGQNPASSTGVALGMVKLLERTTALV
jgi:putative intracellular protease/amidase